MSPEENNPASFRYTINVVGSVFNPRFGHQPLVSPRSSQSAFPGFTFLLVVRPGSGMGPCVCLWACALLLSLGSLTHFTSAHVWRCPFLPHGDSSLASVCSCGPSGRVLPVDSGHQLQGMRQRRVSTRMLPGGGERAKPEGKNTVMNVWAGSPSMGG